MGRRMVVVRDAGTLVESILPDAVLPIQLVPGRPDSAERRLVTAILEEALRNLRLPRDHRHHLDAVKWFASSNRAWPYAFENICDYLNLDADAVRRFLPSVITRQTVFRPRTAISARPRSISSHREPRGGRGGLFAFRNRSV